MPYRTMLVVALAVIAVVSYIWFYPMGTRSTQSDIPGGDARVIAISRPHYIIPREYKGQGGMNPFNFWSHAADPNFGGNKISVHGFVDLDGVTKSVAIQGFNINRTFTNPAYREDVLAIRVGNEIFEFPTPGFEFVVGYGSLAHFIFLGQGNGYLYYYYPVANPYERLQVAIIRIKLPLSDSIINISKSSDEASWNESLEELEMINLSPSAFEDLCSDKPKQSQELARILFKKNC